MSIMVYATAPFAIVFPLEASVATRVADATLVVVVVAT